MKEDADRAAAEAAMDVDTSIDAGDAQDGAQKSHTSQKKADAKGPNGEPAAEEEEKPFEEANKKDADLHGVPAFDGVDHDMQMNLVDDPEEQQKKKGDLYADPILFSQGQVADADGDEFFLLDEEMINELAKNGLRYGCHHNIEFITEERCEDYVMKYICKGQDMAYVRVSEDPLRKDPKSNVVDYDENAYYRKVRYMTSMEAMWRLLSYPIYRMSHVVQALYIHDPRGPVMKFKEGEEKKAGKKAAKGPKKTKLTAYFDLCKVDPAARELRFDEISQQYVFNERQKKWVKRKINLGEIVTRVGTISSANKELFAIRLLLLYCTGVTSWEDLRTVPDKDGKPMLCDTYAQAAELLSLTESDAMWMKVMDAAMSEIPSTNRRRKFYALLLVFNQPSNPMAILNEHLDALCPVSSRRQDWTEEQRINYLLNHIQYHILEHGLTLADVGLPSINNYDDDRVRAEIQGDDEQITDTTDGAPARADAVAYADRVQKQLNTNQADVYKQILDAVDGRVDAQVTNPNHLFFVTGEGGTGKTFLFNALIARINARKAQYVACASTGIAALLLQGGSTAHEAFCISNDVRAEDQSRVKFESYYAQRLRDADLIIIDEVSMMHRVVLEYIEKVLKSCYTDEKIKKKPFCGKVVVLSGDFKQLGPIPFPEDQLGAGDEQRKAAVLTSSLKCSKIFGQFKELKLTQNMRMDPAEVEFRDLVRKIGLGRNFIPGTEYVQLPADRAAANAEEVISFCYPDDFLLNNVDLAKGSNVLLPRNSAVFKWNDVILNRMSDRAKTSVGIDRNMERREDQGAAMLQTHQADHDLENIHMERLHTSSS
ncbi:hypothetical protein QR680_012828 [Steinernema hermaphroditum]|uniref:ATP-dependent DNA helicase n=1 Tax=Steinernema hermaphroditum TaxID=289476 RepID=A0AA39M0I5_9BILA|nr:hypothetical protein QR680_012828 [Steinernema hermaphroditum]